jgi:thiol-disulfide isomerase/thioredoxin
MMQRIFCRSALLLLASVLPLLLNAAEQKPPGPAADAETDWKELENEGRSVSPPAEWQQNAPSSGEIEKFKAGEAQRLAKAAAHAKEFQSRFPDSPHAQEAAHKEYDLLQGAAQLGNTNVIARLDALDQAKANDPKAAEGERVAARLSLLNRVFLSKLDTDRTAAIAEVEKGARALLKEYPGRQEPYEMLMFVAREADPEKSRQIAKEVTQSKASPELKEAAQAMLTKLEAVGKPVPIKFKAVDGRDVDLAKLHGKVVLVDFWATWCGPCVGEVPNVVAAYEKLHPKGFEIVGISFDADKGALERFVKAHKMTWPQYFDGKRWDNDFGKQFGIEGIPTMWLVDKKGNLRDLNAREALLEKVEKFLAENP